MGEDSGGLQEAVVCGSPSILFELSPRSCWEKLARISWTPADRGLLHQGQGWLPLPAESDLWHPRLLSCSQVLYLTSLKDNSRSQRPGEQRVQSFSFVTVSTVTGTVLSTYQTVREISLGKMNLVRSPEALLCICSVTEQNCGLCSSSPLLPLALSYKTEQCQLSSLEL